MHITNLNFTGKVVYSHKTKQLCYSLIFIKLTKLALAIAT